MPLMDSIRKRLSSLIDNHLQAIQRQLSLHPRMKINFNESLLEDWNDLLTRMVTVDSVEAKMVSVRQEVAKKMLPVCSRLPEPAPQGQSGSNGGYLLSIESNICDIYDLKQPFQPILSKIKFQRGHIRRYSSYTFIDPQHVVVIGGSEDKNPNLKCKEVLLMNILSSKISKLGELPYGISSHSAVYIGDQIFIIGGNKDMNMVTKCCLSFHVPSRQAIIIQSLNYASASHTCLNWKDRFIYKIGGVGNCFGSWDLSPYIERYSILEQKWSIINPIVKVDDSMLQHYSLLANSLVYRSSKNSLVILGGYDFNFQPSDKLLEIQVKQSQGDEDDQFEIINIATVQHLQKGGFFQQQPLIVNEQVFAIQSVLSEKGKQLQKIVGISNTVNYYKVQI